MTAEDLAEQAGLLEEAPDENEKTDGGEWTAELLRRCYRESPPPMKAFLAHLASNPDRTFTSADMASRVDRTPRQLAGVLGAFGKRVRNRYSMESWPFDADWSDEAGGMLYRMPGDIAATVIQATA